MQLYKKRLRQIAVEMFEKRDSDLSCPLSEADMSLLMPHAGSEFSIHEGELRLPSEGSRNQLVAEHFYSAEEATQSDWIKKAFEIRKIEGRGGDRVVGRYLALLNQDEDILFRATQAITNEKARVFEVLDLIKAALPYLNYVSVPNLIAMCEAQYELTKRDACAGLLYNDLEMYLEDKPDKSREIVEAVETNMSTANAPLYKLAMMSLSKGAADGVFDGALNDISSSSPILISNALWVVGRLLVLSRISDEQISKAIDVLQSNLKHADADVRQAAIYASVPYAPSSSVLADELDILLEAGNVDAFGSLSALLWQEIDTIHDHPKFDHWLMSLTAFPDELSMDNIDWVLDARLKAGDQKTVISWIESWLVKYERNRSSKREIFDPLSSTYHEILKDGQLRSRLLTEWFVSDHRQLYLAAEAILSELKITNVHNIRLCTKTLNRFDDDDIVLLVRRMLGVVLYGEQLLSLLISMLDVQGAENRTYRVFENVLINEVGLNFPSETTACLNSLKSERKKKAIGEICDRVIASMDAYFDKLKALPRIKEITPSRDLIRKISREQGKSHDRQIKEAQASSIMMQIASVTPLKAGRASFSHFQGEYREPTQLHSVEHSVTLPRMHSLDSIGYEITLLRYQAFKKGEQ